MTGRTGPSAAARGYDARWRKVRAAVLERDGGVCYWCGGPASEADHVRPLVDGGARLAAANLVAACKPCNARRGNAVARERSMGRGLVAGSGFSVGGSTLDPGSLRVSPRRSRPTQA